MSNVIQSIDGANLTLNDQVLATEVGQPMFFWYGQLLNTALIFTPVLIVISMIWLFIELGKGAINKSTLDSKKSLNSK